MVIAKGISITRLLKWSWYHIVWLLGAAAIVACLYNYEIVNLAIPWLPVSVIGTAVAFFVGFKNNQAYDRMWEARKIWGGIVNHSRSWGMQVDGYISSNFNSEITQDELKSIKKRLVYRHIAWLYAHRIQLLVPTPWEHISQTGGTRKVAKMFREKFGIGLIADEVTQIQLEKLLPKNEFKPLCDAQNTATQIVNMQSRDLQELRERNVIDDFRHVELMETLTVFYELQGKNERIKKFPLPRQYANMSRYFVGIFLLLLPFSMMPELMKLGDTGFWLSIPITALVGWVYVMMEVVGDYTENPFQGMANDIPMLSLCRTIEIDMREMLNEKDLPEPIQAKKNILM